MVKRNDFLKKAVIFSQNKGQKKFSCSAILKECRSKTKDFSSFPKGGAKFSKKRNRNPSLQKFFFAPPFLRNVGAKITFLLLFLRGREKNKIISIEMNLITMLK